MLTIQTPPGCTTERAYTLGILLGDWLGIPHTLTQTARAGVSIRLVGQPGEIRLPDSFFAQFGQSGQYGQDSKSGQSTPAPADWLSPASLPQPPLARWDSRALAPDILLTDPLVPVLFGDRHDGDPDAKPIVAQQAEMAQTAVGPADEGRPAAGQGATSPTVAAAGRTIPPPSTTIPAPSTTLRLPIDIFGAAFFMLSRYEEAVLPDRDHHDRFPATASLAYRAGFLDRPLIDEYLEILWTAMQRLWPGLQRKPRQPRTLVTCDVDSPFAYTWTHKDAVRSLGGDLLKRRSLTLAWQNWRGYRRAQRGLPHDDPHLAGLAFIMDVNERAGRPVAFYFIPETTDPQLDNSVTLDDPRLRTLLREIHARGHEIGIHPGYHTYRHPEALTQSVVSLRRVLAEEAIDQSQLGGRQHYLRWATPITARLWDDNSLSYDSTLSYAECPGFRCGTCREYTLYDLQQRRPLRLRERPLIIMERTVIAAHYLGLGNGDEALNLMQKYRDICHRFGGDFTLLWHNSHLNQENEKRLYLSLVG